MRSKKQTKESVLKVEDIKYKRVLLKLSGEALAGDRKTGIDAETVGNICDLSLIHISEPTRR